MPRIQAGELELFYESTGEGTPFILQAHHHISWMPYQIPYFSQYYNIITFDRRGTGRSSNPPGPWSIADLAADVRNLMDVLEIDKAIVGGASLGGVISCQFGLDYPDRSLALIVGHTVPYLWPLASDWIDDQVAAIERGERPIVMQPRSYEWEEEGPPTANPNFADSHAGRFAASLTQMGGGGPEAGIHMIRALGAWDIRSRYNELNELDVPALVIVGGHEPQKTVEYSYEWHQEFKRSDFVIMPDSYHGAAREQPVEWNAAVHTFLQRNGL